MPRDTVYQMPLWPMFLYAGIVVILLGAILSLSYVLGQHHSDRATGKPYEGGIEQTGSARLRFSAQFYLVAMLFVVFDIEAVFLMLWAVGFFELGWPGYIGAAIFVTQLIVVLIYEWGTGALDIGINGKKILKLMHQKNKQYT